MPGVRRARFGALAVTGTEGVEVTSAVSLIAAVLGAAALLGGSYFMFRGASVKSLLETQRLHVAELDKALLFERRERTLEQTRCNERLAQLRSGHEATTAEMRGRVEVLEGRVLAEIIDAIREAVREIGVTTASAVREVSNGT